MPPRRSLLLRLLLVLIATALSATIAATTIFDAHPDEKAHVDAFQYFETHWQRPPLGSQGILYSPMGWSRVFTPEIVYPLYGKIARLIGLVVNVEPFRLYRYLNVALLAFTLTALMLLRCKWCDLSILAMAMIAIPQVPYLYAYANSDAWGTTCAVLLFAQSAAMIDSHPRDWRWWRIALFMLNLLLLILSKVGFLVGLLMPIALIALWLLRRRRREPSARWITTRIALPLLLVAIPVVLWHPSLSPLHPDWRQRVLQMREQVALEGFKPSSPTRPGLYMSSKGQTYADVLNTGWIPGMAKTFYSGFGGWQVHHPFWTFIIAAVLGVSALALTLVTTFRGRQYLPRELLLCLCLSPVVLSLNIYGALWHALHIDCQSQGRYLFPSLAAVYFLTFATTRYEPPTLRRLHLLILFLAIALSFYILLTCGILDPTMRRIPFWYGFT